MDSNQICLTIRQITSSHLLLLCSMTKYFDGNTMAQSLQLQQICWNYFELKRFQKMKKYNVVKLGNTNTLYRNAFLVDCFKFFRSTLPVVAVVVVVVAVVVDVVAVVVVIVAVVVVVVVAVVDVTGVVAEAR